MEEIRVRGLPGTSLEDKEARVKTSGEVPQEEAMADHPTREVSNEVLGEADPLGSSLSNREAGTCGTRVEGMVETLLAVTCGQEIR